VRKRLRVHTVRLKSTDSPQELYKQADADVILSLVTHKIIRACLDAGPMEGREMLKDWLTVLLAKYNEQLRAPRNLQREIAVDLMFSSVAPMRPVPKLVFSLLKSPLLRLSADSRGLSISPDEWNYHQCYFSSMDPHNLNRALYPVLYSFGAPNNFATQHLPLSKSALETSGSTIFLIDALTLICIFYLEKAEAEFPPPKDSFIRSMANKLRLSQLKTPRLVITREGLQDSFVFENLLLEESNFMGPSFSKFTEFLNKNVIKCMEANK